MEIGETEVIHDDENPEAELREIERGETQAINGRSDLAAVVFGSMIGTIQEIASNRSKEGELLSPFQLVEYYSVAVAAYNTIREHGQVVIKQV